MICITLVLLFLNILNNVDHGAVPSASVALKDDLGIDNVMLGTLGSLVFLGTLTGSFFAAIFINKFKL